MHVTVQPADKTRDSPGFGVAWAPDNLLDFMFNLVDGQARGKIGNLAALW